MTCQHIFYNTVNALIRISALYHLRNTPSFSSMLLVPDWSFFLFHRWMKPQTKDSTFLAWQVKEWGIMERFHWGKTQKHGYMGLERADNAKHQDNGYLLFALPSSQDVHEEEGGTGLFERFTHFVESVAAAAVCALHSVAPQHTHFLPYYHPGRRLPGLLHQEAAAVHDKCRGHFIQDFRKSLWENISSDEKMNWTDVHVFISYTHIQTHLCFLMCVSSNLSVDTESSSQCITSIPCEILRF